MRFYINCEKFDDRGKRRIKILKLDAMGLFQNKIIKVLLVISIGIGGNTFYRSAFDSLCDLNGNGIIDVCDFQQFLAMISKEDLSVSDLNFDGKVDIKDLQVLLNNVGKKVSNTVAHDNILYFSGVLAFFKVSKPRVVEIEALSKLAKVQTLEFAYRKLSKGKSDVFRECFFPVGEVKGSFNLALHISPSSPPYCSTFSRV
ncbi:MAG: hypothetical protein N3G21_02955 [Candidatus Hydrogenedentes bacterium]|nr:hypothetical protein [Candidatus Hydrogenedentota bacterium]